MPSWWRTGQQRGWCRLWNNSSKMGEKNVGWLVTNESGGRQAKWDGGKGIWLRMWADRIKRKQACVSRAFSGDTQIPAWSLEACVIPEFGFKCVSAWMSKRTTLLMRIWNSSHRLWPRELGSAVSNDTLPLHKNKERPLENQGRFNCDAYENWGFENAFLLSIHLFIFTTDYNCEVALLENADCDLRSVSGINELDIWDFTSRQKYGTSIWKLNPELFW